jgi:hypothetical protein
MAGSTSFADALSLYKQYFGGYVALRAERGLGSDSFRPLFIGTHWPSIAMVLPWERGPKIAAAALQPQDDDDEQMRKERIAHLDEGFGLLQTPHRTSLRSTRLCQYWLLAGPCRF